MAHHEPKHDEHPRVYCHDVIQSSKPVHTYRKEWKVGRFPQLTPVHEHRRSCIRRLTLAAGLTPRHTTLGPRLPIPSFTYTTISSISPRAWPPLAATLTSIESFTRAVTTSGLRKRITSPPT